MDGLNKQEIEYRQNNGMINNENIKNSRTVKQIILSNTITLFNILKELNLYDIVDSVSDNTIFKNRKIFRKLFNEKKRKRFLIVT